MKQRCRVRGCKSGLGKNGRHYFHPTCARQAGFTVEGDKECFSLACFIHSETKNNFRAKLEDLLDVEVSSFSKGGTSKPDLSMTYPDASLTLYHALEVMRILGWAWRWAEWWVEENFNWEPFLPQLQDGLTEEDFTDEEKKIVHSTRESRCADARRCRLAALGAALRNRNYDTADGFDNASLAQALRAVLRTKSLVGPMTDAEVDFCVEWLSRAYRSKDKLLGFGEDKIEIGNAEWCYHKSDKSPKFELGGRPLPGETDFAYGINFSEVDDFLLYGSKTKEGIRKKKSPSSQTKRKRNQNPKKGKAKTECATAVRKRGKSDPQSAQDKQSAAAAPPPKRRRGRPRKNDSQVVSGKQSAEAATNCRKKDPSSEAPNKQLTEAAGNAPKRRPGRPPKNRSRMVQEEHSTSSSVDAFKRRPFKPPTKEPRSAIVKKRAGKTLKRKRSIGGKELAKDSIAEKALRQTAKGGDLSESEDCPNGIDLAGDSRGQIFATEGKTLPQGPVTGKTLRNVLIGYKSSDTEEGAGYVASERGRCQLFGTEQKTKPTVPQLTRPTGDADRKAGKGDACAHISDSVAVGSGGEVELSESKVAGGLKEDAQPKAEREKRSANIQLTSLGKRVPEDLSASDTETEASSDETSVYAGNKTKRPRKSSPAGEGGTRAALARKETALEVSENAASKIGVAAQYSSQEGTTQEKPTKFNKRKLPSSRKIPLEDDDDGASDDRSDNVVHARKKRAVEEHDENVVGVLESQENGLTAKKGGKQRVVDSSDVDATSVENKNLSETKPPCLEQEELDESEPEQELEDYDDGDTTEIEEDDEENGDDDDDDDDEPSEDDDDSSFKGGKSVISTATFRSRRRSCEEEMAMRLGLGNMTEDHVVAKHLQAKGTRLGGRKSQVTDPTAGLTPSASQSAAAGKLPLQQPAKSIVKPALGTTKPKKATVKWGIKGTSVDPQDMKDKDKEEGEVPIFEEGATFCGRSFAINPGAEDGVSVITNATMFPHEQIELDEVKHDNVFDRPLEVDRDTFPPCIRIDNSHSCIHTFSIRQPCIVCCMKCHNGFSKGKPPKEHSQRSGSKTRFGCQECYLALYEHKYNIKIDRNNIPATLKNKYIFLCSELPRKFEGGVVRDDLGMGSQQGSTANSDVSDDDEEEGLTCFEIWHRMMQLPNLPCCQPCNSGAPHP
jgi:hypothetical protein